MAAVASPSAIDGTPKNFVEDMGEKPSQAHTIERRDFNGNYEPLNCCWIPKPEQGKNTRSTRIVMIHGITATVPEWCAVTGVDYWVANARIRRGWMRDKAVVTPSRRAA